RLSVVHRSPSFSLPTRPPPRSPLFPYTTLFRSRVPLRAERRPPRARTPGGRCDRRRGLHHPSSPPRAARRGARPCPLPRGGQGRDRKSTRLNSSHVKISYAVFCLKKKITTISIY